MSSAEQFHQTELLLEHRPYLIFRDVLRSQYHKSPDQLATLNSPEVFDTLRLGFKAIAQYHNTQIIDESQGVYVRFSDKPDATINEISAGIPPLLSRAIEINHSAYEHEFVFKAFVGRGLFDMILHRPEEPKILVHLPPRLAIQENGQSSSS